MRFLRKNKELSCNKSHQFNRAYYIVGVFLCVVCAGILGIKQISYADWIDTEEGVQYEYEDGSFARGFVVLDGESYYFDEDAYLVTGKFFCKEDQNYYYADKSGRIQTGIIKTKKSFYVADEQGKIQRGFVEYENERYFFDGSATLVKGWFKNENDWYYADENGIIMTGFITVDGDRFYLDSDGKRVSDEILEIDGITYIFNKDGSVDENATFMYPVYQYITDLRKQQVDLSSISMNSKVQACAILRASDLRNGYRTDEDSVLERILRNCGVKSQGGYEISYGGIENYDRSRLLSDLKRDLNFQKIIKDENVSEVGLGVYEQEGIYYYDIIFTCGQVEE